MVRLNRKTSKNTKKTSNSLVKRLTCTLLVHARRARLRRHRVLDLHVTSRGRTALLTSTGRENGGKKMHYEIALEKTNRLWEENCDGHLNLKKEKQTPRPLVSPLPPGGGGVTGVGGWFQDVAPCFVFFLGGGEAEFDSPPPPPTASPPPSPDLPLSQSHQQ